MGWRSPFGGLNVLAYESSTLESTAETRERLILEHLPQVHLLARRIHEKVAGRVSLEDLISTGVLGLISAVDNFDPNAGVKLRTYAEYKIRGAILDSLRALDWASRYCRKKARQIEAAISRVEQRVQRQPGEEEVAAELGISLREYQDKLTEVQGVNLLSLEMASGRGEETRIAMVPDEDELPSEAMERSQLETLVAQSIAGMTDIEKTILALYYQEELTLREISSIVRLSTSRIAEIKSHSVLKLRSVVRSQWPNRGALR
jgi:RNA polymerase sigma factor FliA